MAVYLAAAVWVMHSLLFDPVGQIIAHNARDQANFEWMLTAIKNRLLQGHSPLFSSAMNAPNGVNLIANPSMPVLSIMAIPLTVTLGAARTLAFILTANLAATAGAWYWFFLRHPAPSAGTVTAAAMATGAAGPPTPGISPARRRLVAAFGGLICGFSPAMIAHSWGHPNLTAQWLFPLIVDRALRLGRRDPDRRTLDRRTLGSAAVLGVLAAAQVGIAEEPLFIAVFALAILLLLRVVQAPRAALSRLRPFLADSALAGITAGLLVAYPLWFQFRGPQSYTGLAWGQDAYAATMQSYVTLAPTSVFGNLDQSTVLAPNITESSAFVGIPLLLAALAAAVLAFTLDRARRRGILALAATCVALIVLSVGDTDLPDQHEYGLPWLPNLWPLLRKLPFFTDALPVRLSLAVFPILAYLLVSALHKLPLNRPRLWWSAAGAALLCVLSLTPVPVETQPRPATPAFITAGLWRQCASPGQAVLAYPTFVSAMDWSIAADQQFPIVGGVLFSPDATGAVQLEPYRPTTRLLDLVDQSGTVPAITPEMRAQAVADVRYWGLGCVALDSGTGGALHPTQDRALLTGLFGPPVDLGSVWTWSFRSS